MNLWKERNSILRQIKLPKGGFLIATDRYVGVEQPHCSVLRHTFQNDRFEWALAGDRAKKSIVVNILKQFIALKPEYRMPNIQRRSTWQSFDRRTADAPIPKKKG